MSASSILKARFMTALRTAPRVPQLLRLPQPHLLCGRAAEHGHRRRSLANNHSGDRRSGATHDGHAAQERHRLCRLDRDGARPRSLVPTAEESALSRSPNNGTQPKQYSEGGCGSLRSSGRALVCHRPFHGGEGWSYVREEGRRDVRGREPRRCHGFAHAAIDAGADLVIGQGPHVPRSRCIAAI